LGVAGFQPVGARAGVFCDVTEAAVRSFQRDHGLADNGTCDERTWLALVESSWRLGERSLRLVVPYLRGDDVTALQAALARLGFDCGRIDGILGPDTARAVMEFQRNCGLDVDGVCGPFTVRALEVNASRSGTGPGMAALRELAQLGSVAASLAKLRIVIGHFGGLAPLTRQLGRQLRHHQAKVVVADQPEPSDQAAAANRHQAIVYLGLESRPDAVTGLAYYATPGFESRGGRALADHLAAELAVVAQVAPPEVVGRRLPVLRETRMTAVVCSLGPVQRVTDAVPAISGALVAGLAAWTAAPVGSPSA
jgi:N-acetylmuramoyl-L-alanine amidase